MGSCNCWGFWPELDDVTTTISFAAADSALKDENRISTGPANSFMHYWQEAVDENTDFDFDQTFDYAKAAVADYYPLIDDILSAGFHTARFNASTIPSGVYFYKIVAGEFTDIKRMLLIK